MWAIIDQAPGYEVSPEGEVRCVVATVRKPVGAPVKSWLSAKGYPIVKLQTDDGAKNFLVHRLVATAFLGKAPTKDHEVAHNDGNRANPNVKNLRWATRKENISDRLIHGTQLRGERVWNSKLDAEKVANIRTAAHSCAYYAALYGVSPKYVSNVRAGTSWAYLRGEA